MSGEGAIGKLWREKASYMLPPELSLAAGSPFERASAGSKLNKANGSFFGQQRVIANRQMII